jgi:hypothetical protein
MAPRTRAKQVFASFLICAALVLFAFPPSPTRADNKGIELNTTLMELTFMIEGQAAPPNSGMTLGTIFLMGRPFPNQPSAPNQQLKMRYVLITAAHVLEGIQGDTAIVYFRHELAPGVWVPLPTPIPIRAGGHPLWTTNPNADVAAMYIRVPRAATLPDSLLPTNLLAGDDQLATYDIHPGDQLFCLGYPFGRMSSSGGFPILRSGTIASFPLLPTSQTKTFLFDFPVFKGNSGGPVYIAQSDRVYGGAAHLGESLHFIVGLVSQELTYNEQLAGQYSAELHEYQLGLAVVVQASLIKQTIEMLPSPETLPE